MKKYIKQDEWNIIEETFIPQYNRISESIFSIGNGNMGQRANFEEKYSGDSLRGNYLAGIYYPDKTRVGWWKNGYPEYFAKIINAPNWIGIDAECNGIPVDLATCEVISFKRVLHMRHGLLERQMILKLPNGNQLEVISKRFVSMDTKELGAISYSVKALNFDGEISFLPYLDGDVKNEDANYDEKFWVEKNRNIKDGEGFLLMATKKTNFRVCTSMTVNLHKNNRSVDASFLDFSKDKFVGTKIPMIVKQGDVVTIDKFAGITSSLNHPQHEIISQSVKIAQDAKKQGFTQLLEKQKEAWAKIWATSDIRIAGDAFAQQGIRFNIFQLYQSYSGDDERLNIGPKGFTGEKYGGVTYWDTEAFCLPFFLGTANEQVPRNLLLYRYKHLSKAIENAEKLGFTNGAALYPMVTINGEECHNEWEITFEEIHRNGAMAYAIWNYVNYTGDKNYLAPYGFEVLLGISRFWVQRTNWSAEKQAYVILGVTGPNEYENNVNNNLHTNKIAVWTLQYTLEVIDFMKSKHAFLFAEISAKHKFIELEETKRWKEIIQNMYFPYDEESDVFLQQDGFLDKVIESASNIPNEEKPLNQHWSWDRILRSCYIKQADTLQHMFWFEDHYSDETIKRHFDYYEPLTVHESSLSACVHSILAAKTGYHEKAYQYFLQSVRLDLDDYNNDANDGLHVTSMGGSWMAFVMGMAGMRVKNGTIVFHPFLPAHWTSYTFRLKFRKAELYLKMNQAGFTAHNLAAAAVSIQVWNKKILLEGQHSQLFSKEESATTMENINKSN